MTARPAPPPPRKIGAGFTLTELMVTVGIGAIMLTLAAPSFQESIRNNRLTAQSNDLFTSLNLARSEAVKRRSIVSLCTSSDQASCTNSNWSAGWIVRDETSGDVIRAFPAMKGGTTVTSADNQVRYAQTGFLVGGAPVSLKLCAGAGKQGRQIDISVTGRPTNISPNPTC